jgi:hypothetical protein
MQNADAKAAPAAAGDGLKEGMEKHVSYRPVSAIFCVEMRTRAGAASQSGKKN